MIAAYDNLSKDSKKLIIKNLFFSLIVIIFALIIYLFFFDKEIKPQFNSYDTNQKPFIISLYGDSLMSGYLLNDSQHLSVQLNHLLNNFKVPNKIINSSVSGNTTDQGLQRMQDIITLKPDIVILCLGANDMFLRVDVNIIHKNLEKIITELQKNNIKIILAGMYASPILSKAYKDDFKNIYLILSKKYNLIFMPFILEDIIFNNKYLLVDRSHPNFEGVKIIANNLIKYLAMIL